MSFLSTATIPNFGRPYGRAAPISIDNIFPDSNTPKNVYLRVVVDSRDLTGRNRFWLVTWRVDDSSPYPTMMLPVFRKFGLTQEHGLSHLTNWGVVTKASSASWIFSEQFLLGTLSLTQRRQLEQIAEREPVLPTTQQWNCQTWIISLLYKAEQQGIFTHTQWTAAVEAAR